MTPGTRVVVIRSDRGHTGRNGTLVELVQSWHYPFLVRLDGGPTIWTNDLGIAPVAIPEERKDVTE